MDFKKIAEKLGLDIKDIKELFDLYMQTTSADLESLKAAIEAGDAELIHKKAHSIKGASGNLYLDELYGLAREIDDRARANSLDGLADMVQILQNKYNEFVEKFDKSS